ncbi:MAG: diguanylate cyclase [Aquabacterium sp.]
MNLLTDLSSGSSGISTVQYLMVLALLMGLLVAGLTALVHCKTRWLHDWLKLSWFGDLLLSKDPRQKIICLRYMVAGVNCIAGIAALNYGVSQGLVPRGSTAWLTVTGLLVTFGYYAIIRGGWNNRLSDPTMGSFHTNTAILYLAWGYQLGGPGRPVALLLLFIILMFSMFTTDVRSLVRSSILAAVSFGLVMAHVATSESHVPSMPQLQLVYFCLLLIMLISVCLLMSQLTRLRAKSTRHKEELTEALGRIQELATRDELTGLFNRRHMLELLNTEKHRSIRTERRFCIGLIDVDHFKSVNDTHGHGVGDEVLTAVAIAITGGLRETDIVARWGGEEFLIMFTDTDCATAEVVLTRIQKTLSTAIVSPTVNDLRVTFSAGLTHYDAEEMLTRTIDRADRALYMAKASGRNRVTRMAPPPIPSTETVPAPLTSIPLEHGHALDVGGMGKHVHGAT